MSTNPIVPILIALLIKYRTHRCVLGFHGDWWRIRLHSPLWSSYVRYLRQKGYFYTTNSYPKQHQSIRARTGLIKAIYILTRVLRLTLCLSILRIFNLFVALSWIVCIWDVHRASLWKQRPKWLWDLSWTISKIYIRIYNIFPRKININSFFGIEFNKPFFRPLNNML